jgi:hypothetical protein
MSSVGSRYDKVTNFTSGIQTRAARVLGEYSTTGPSKPINKMFHEAVDGGKIPVGENILRTIKIVPQRMRGRLPD